MKYDKFFELAKERGIEECDLAIGEEESLSFSIFHGEIDEYTANNSLGIIARGIINGKFGTATSDYYDNEIAEKLVNDIVNNARVIENDDPSIIFEGSSKYKRINLFNKELGNVPTETKIADAKAIEEKIRAYDKRIVEVGAVEYQEEVSKRTIINSKGLKLTSKSNSFVMFAYAVASDGKVTKNGIGYQLDNDYSKLNIDKIVKEAAEDALNKLGGLPAKTKTYRAVLDPDVVRPLLDVLVSYASSEDVQKHSSLFEGKLDKQVASKHLTVEDRPLDKTLFASSFDDEGVATKNLTIIKNGVLKTYLYDLRTAKKDGVESTGNGYRAGAAIGITPTHLVLKKGRLTQEQLFAKVKNGVYITSVTGLHAGLNARSGNFSLQAEGFEIKDGKIDHPFDIITISGNILELFNDIVAVGNDAKPSFSSTLTPSILIKKIKVSGQ